MRCTVSLLRFETHSNIILLCLTQSFKSLYASLQSFTADFPTLSLEVNGFFTSLFIETMLRLSSVNWQQAAVINPVTKVSIATLLKQQIMIATV